MAKRGSAGLGVVGLGVKIFRNIQKQEAVRNGSLRNDRQALVSRQSRIPGCTGNSGLGSYAATFHRCPEQLASIYVLPRTRHTCARSSALSDLVVSGFRRRPR